MDWKVKSNRNWFENLERSFQLTYLKSKVLNTNSKLFDYGYRARLPIQEYRDVLNFNIQLSLR